MSTKRLARELGLIRRHSQTSRTSPLHPSSTKQIFSYLIIIDFESTCWRERSHRSQEIIEFPAVLLNTANGDIEAQFHTYVQPQEHPVLSSFCTQLTGITQKQVEAGLPLPICLSRFTRWLHTLQRERGVVFLMDTPPSAEKPCAFVTWSDWDLGVCLLYECKRKQILKPEVLNSWIDLRATYRMFYNRKPKGLNGALQDLALEFSGREHSGLDDSRNTARLAWRMISDGCVMKITKSVSRVQMRSKAAPPTGLTSAPPPAANMHLRTAPPSATITHCGTAPPPAATTHCETAPPPAAITHCGTAPPPETAPHGVCQSLVSPLTVLDSTVMTVLPVTTLTLPPHSHLTTQPHPPCSDWSEYLLPEAESSSYDDVVIEDSSEQNPNHTVMPHYGGKPHPLRQHSLKPHPLTEPHRIRTSFSVYTDRSCSSALYSRLNTDQSAATNQATLPSYFIKKSQHSLSSINQSMPSCSFTNKSALLSISNNQSARCSNSTNQSVASSRFVNPLSTPSTVNQSACSSYLDNQSALCSSSVNQSALSSRLMDSAKRGAPPHQKGGVKITSPLCDCGRRSRRLTVCNGGPNQGRVFYTCAVRKSTGPAPFNCVPRGKGCGFFRWESALVKSTCSRMSFGVSSASCRSFR